jgi:HSP20 family protein
MGRMLGDAFTGLRGRSQHPDVDVEENDDGWEVEVRLPGVAPEEVAVDLADRELTIRSSKSESDESSSRYAGFVYRFTVPSDVDPDQIDATMDHGLLKVRLPRRGGVPSRRIEVGKRSGTAEALPAGESEETHHIEVTDADEAPQA